MGNQLLPHLAIHELELDQDLLSLLIRPLSQKVYDGCLISTCNKGKGEEREGEIKKRKGRTLMSVCVF